ncbi:MAG: hypothetical protein KatS3mg114_1088 [Planctomycetaceae bacterium]|nr:MAG: hypothetical protein KatS3mg114_1088 [Planctomycetaceae bacterium]
MSPLPSVPPELVRQSRTARQHDPWQPQGWCLEQEPMEAGDMASCLAMFLTGQECPFACMFCDLWQHTVMTPTPAGALPHQVQQILYEVSCQVGRSLPSALEPPHRVANILPQVQIVKLYNSSNFFDPRAVPVEDYPALAASLAGIARVVVENHPRLCQGLVPRFRALLSGRLEVALGLETIHPELLPRLNKQMSWEDVERAVERLHRWDCDVRGFVLLGLPGLTVEECMIWAARTVSAAWDLGIRHVSLIPWRGTWGFWERPEWQRLRPKFRPDDLYAALTLGLEQRRGLLQLDLWDAQRWLTCPSCAEVRLQTLRTMNLRQQVLPWPQCVCDAERIERAVSEPR